MTTLYTNVIPYPRCEFDPELSQPMPTENELGAPASGRSNVPELDMPISGESYGFFGVNVTTEARLRTRLVDRGEAEEGQRWWFRVLIQARAGNAAARDLTVGVRFYDTAPGAAAGTTLATTYSTPVSLPPGGDVVEMIVSAVAPADTQSVAGIIRRESGATDDGFIYDDVVLVSSLEEPPLGVPGDPGWDWAGTPDASVSIYAVEAPELTAHTDADPAERVSIYFPALRPSARFITLRRYVDGETTQIVRGARFEPMVGGFVVFDVEVPLNREVTYQAELFDENGVSMGFTDSGSITVVVDEPLGVRISDPLDPNLVVRGVIDDLYASVVRKGRVAGYAETGGANASTLLAGGKQGYVDLPLGFFTETLAETRRFRQLRDQTPIAVLRTVNPDIPIPGTLYVALVDASEVRIDAEYTHWPWTSREVRNPEASAVVPLRTYADYMAFFVLYSDAMAVFATYVDAVLNPPPSTGA